MHLTLPPLARPQEANMGASLAPSAAGQCSRWSLSPLQVTPCAPLHALHASAPNCKSDARTIAVDGCCNSVSQLELVMSPAPLLGIVVRGLR